MMPHFARAAFDAIRMQKSGPAFFEVCDPILLASESRGTQIAALYRKLANPALRLALSRAGLPQLSDPALAGAIRGAIIAARDAISPDWVALAKPIAQLLDACPQPARERPPVAGLARLPPLRAIEEVIRACAAHLLECFARRGFIPGYAAFDLMGDPGFRGQELLTAMAALEARSYRNATLLFNLLRVFLLANPAAAALVSPPWTGSSQRLSSPVQIRHRSAYYDAFFSEALTDYLRSGLATPRETAAARKAIATMMDFCLKTSGERVRAPGGGEPVTAITALVSPPDVRMTRFFWQLKHELGFGAYIPDCDTTACAISAATRCGFEEPPLNYPFVDLFAARQTGADGAQRPTLTINDHIAYDGAILTWIENLAGELPFGNDIDPTLNLDVLEVSFRNYANWDVARNVRRRDVLRRIVLFQFRLIESGAFAEPRSHIYYLPELYCAYFARCYRAFAAMPEPVQAMLDPGRHFTWMREQVLAYAVDFTSAEMNAFDAALALLALAKLGAGPELFAPALNVIAASFGEGRSGAPFRSYEWNKMKTPARILVGGQEVTSAFVLSALIHARAALLGTRAQGA